MRSALRVLAVMWLVAGFAACEQESAAPGSGAAAVANGAADTDYPLSVCLVSDEPLGSMGDPVVIEHEGREVQFCCKACVGKFKADPKKYLAKLDEAVADTAEPTTPEAGDMDDHNHDHAHDHDHDHG